jgi:hypothetical protein
VFGPFALDIDVCSRSYLLQNHTAFASRLQYLGLPAAAEPRAAAEQVLR